MKLWYRHFSGLEDRRNIRLSGGNSGHGGDDGDNVELHFDG